MKSTNEAREARLRSLLIAAQGGDARAYSDFLRELALVLRGFFRRRLISLPDEVEDLVQETLLAVHNKRHTYEPEQPVTAWLFAIARYKLVDRLRAHAGREALHEPFEDATELASEADSAAHEAKRDLRMLLAQLPDKQRLPIQYVKLEGMSVAQAARLTGLSESAVKIGVYRGLRLLAARLRAKR